MLFAFGCVGGSRAEPPFTVSIQPAVTKARLRGLHAAGPRNIWASGTGGTYLHTSDGSSWKTAVVPGAEALDFRDVHAFDDRSAVLLSSGPGDKSRLYRTEDGGATWKISFTNPDSEGFLDAISFWSRDDGVLFGDPVRGHFTIFLTADGGRNWQRPGAPGMPHSLPGEGAFAASGTCLTTSGPRNAWFVTGGAAGTRAFRSDNGGITWQESATPVKAGEPSAGLFSVAFRDSEHGVAIGGDYKNPDATGAICTYTEDGGKTWILSTRPPAGYRSAVAFVPDISKNQSHTWIATGPTGTDISLDDGATWESIGKEGFHAVSVTSGPVGWAVGDDGRVARIAQTAR